jgi:hypothetical protein
MRTFVFAIGVAALLVSIRPEIALAQEAAGPAEIAAARRALAAAKIEARQYSQVEYQCQKRELDAAIRISDEEVRTMRRQLRSFGTFNAFAYGQQPAFGYRNARLFLAEAETRRRLLIAERNDLARSRNDQMALSNLNVAAARARLVDLTGGGVIELNGVEQP